MTVPAATTGIQLTQTMRAVIQDGYGADVLHLGEIERPAPTDDRVLVRVYAASINAADCHFVRGALPVQFVSGLGRPKIAVRGLDLAGTVEEVGGNVVALKPGDEVFGTGRATFAEYATAPEDRLVRKPRRLTFEQAAAVPIAGVTALQGLRDKAQVRPGQRVLVYGAGGGVGTFAVQIAKALGAHVTAVTGPRNVDLVRALGPDETIDYTKEDILQRRERYDVFFDVAATRPLVACLRVLEPTGTFVGAGAPKGSALAVALRLLMMQGLARRASQRIVSFMARVTDDDLFALVDLIETGRLTPAIDRTCPLDEAPAAIRYALSGQARAKVVITMLAACGSNEGPVRSDLSAPKPGRWSA